MEEGWREGEEQRKREGDMSGEEREREREEEGWRERRGGEARAGDLSAPSV